MKHFFTIVLVAFTTLLQARSHNSVVKALASPSNVSSLSIHPSELKLLAENATKFTHLQALFIKGDTVGELGNGIENLPALKTIEITKSHVTGVSSSFSEVNTLRNIKFEKVTGLVQLNNDDVDWYNVEQVEFIKMSVIPSDIDKFQGLRRLIFYKNKVDHLPAATVWLTNLEYLSVEKTPILALPLEIGNLKQLKTLALVKTKVGALPDDICELENLQSLIVQGSQYTSLPEGCINDLAFTDIRKGYFRGDDAYILIGNRGSVGPSCGNSTNLEEVFYWGFEVLFHVTCILLEI